MTDKETDRVDVAPDRPCVRAESAGALTAWQPIVTAPHGVVVMFCDPNGNRWIDCAPSHPNNWIVAELEPTHWMRLPEPPSSAHAETDEDYMCPNCVTPWKCNGPHLMPWECDEAEETASAPAVVSDNVRKMEGDSASPSSRGGTSPEVEEALKFADMFPHVTHDMAYFERHIKPLAAEVRRLRASTTTAEALPVAWMTNDRRVCGEGLTRRPEQAACWHDAIPLYAAPAPHVAPPEETPK